MVKPYYQDALVAIYHGRCEDILPSLPKADLILTDPPYGISYRHGNRKGNMQLGFDGHSIVGDTEPFDPSVLLKSDAKIIIWGANHFADRLPASRGWIVWDKREGIPANDQSDCELAWSNFLTVARLFSRYWNGGGITEVRYHVNQKPLKLITWCLELAGKPELTLDPFMGSGTALVAAKDLGRYAIGIEIEERYCEIAARRCETVQPALFDTPVKERQEQEAMFV